MKNATMHETHRVFHRRRSCTFSTFHGRLCINVIHNSCVFVRVYNQRNDGSNLPFSHLSIAYIVSCCRERAKNLPDGGRRYLAEAKFLSRMRTIVTTYDEIIYPVRPRSVDPQEKFATSCLENFPREYVQLSPGRLFTQVSLKRYTSPDAPVSFQEIRLS